MIGSSILHALKPNRAKSTPAASADAKPAAPQADASVEAQPEVAAKSDRVEPEVLLHIENPNTPPTTPLVHKAAVGAVVAAAAWTATNIAMHIAGAPTLAAAVGTAAVAVGSAVAAYAAADLGSGLFHWTIDNYPTGKTPVIGKMAAEFQEHHHRTNDLEDYTFASNIANAGRFLWLPLAAVAALNPGVAIQSAALAFIGGTVLAQGSHRWSHEANPPAIAKLLQKAHVVQPRENHLTHHKLPWDDYYCIVNGMWNKTLSKIDAFRVLENTVYKLTGAEPHSWKDPGVKAYAQGKKTREQFLAERVEDKKVFVAAVKAEWKEYAAQLNLPAGKQAEQPRPVHASADEILR